MATTDAVLAGEVHGSNRTRLAPANAHLAAGVIDAEFSEVPTRHLRDYLRLLYKYRWLAAACFGVTFGLVAVSTLRISCCGA